MRRPDGASVFDTWSSGLLSLENVEEMIDFLGLRNFLLKNNLKFGKYILIVTKIKFSKKVFFCLKIIIILYKHFRKFQENKPLNWK